MFTYKKLKLKNGLRLILSPMKNTETVTFLAMVGAGSKYESDEIAGISHFLEHIFFKGTKKRPNTRAISEYLDAVGGEYNAFTSKEYTGFYAKVAVKYITRAFDFISDILQNAKFPEAEIEKERYVILEEMKMHFDTPMIHISELFEKLLYGEQAAGRLIIGAEKSIMSLQRQDFISYLKKMYQTGNMVLTVCGRFREKEIKNLAENYFNNLFKGKGGEKEKVVEKQKKPQILAQKKKTDQTHLCLGVRAYHHLDRRRWPLLLLSLILGGTMSSRLFINIRDKYGLAYYIRSSVENYTDSGYLVIQAGVDNQKISEAIKLIILEIRKILKDGITKEEIKKAKENLKGKMLLELETSDELALFLTLQELLKKKIDTSRGIFKKIDAVTLLDIRKVAKDIFKNNKLNLAVIGPEADKDNLLKILHF
ncbi:MAG: pitrilysin family protein [Patescibacteria group bacterium]